MAKIKGVEVILVDKVETGKDPLNHPIYKDVEIPISNVLVSPSSTDDITNQLNLTGRKAIYTLGIPKGDANNWENKEVIFFNQRWQTFGIPLEGIESMIPLDWNKKVMVERYGE